MSRNFFNLYSHDFARVAVAVPNCKVADPEFNAAATLLFARRAAAHGAVLVAFPELGISAYTCDDPFHQRALLDACEDAPKDIVEESKSLNIAMIVGAPIKVEHKLFNCAIVNRGRQDSRRRAEELSAELRRVLRGASVFSRRCRHHADA